MTTSEPIRFTAELSLLDGPMFTHAIRIPPDIGELFRTAKGAIRVLCSIGRKDEFPCALNPRGDEYIIIVSKALIRQHKLAGLQNFEVSIRTDPDNGLLLPEEFQEVLDQDEWGKRLFEALLPGHKRGYIYYVRSAKSVDTRIKRAFEIVEKLKTTKR
ncbi:YdeI/OmpD-associated family protein [Rhodocytophaga rosea]|uniref:YdeI/OmpD-associated family protein n=1 Tax=Rhodocytophaga rosea TaxID=2704465 RepID=A0A6C0GT28_9BACT|nr:YdeI/OmpD-associated family protein [Rhodocytophaga rosea]QHT71321.1 YdeI/OmpD-associated family protein [Rhodocytophaga rosea]